jgi:S1-C subfamily serine protease
MMFALLGSTLLILGLSVAANLYMVRLVFHNDGRYDNDAILLSSAPIDVSLISQAMVRLKTTTKYRPGMGEATEAVLEGTGIMLGHGFILTVAHSISQDKMRVGTPVGPVEVPIENKQSEKTYVEREGQSHEVKVILKDKRNDVALLKAPSGLRIPAFPYPLGNSNDLHVGNFVYAIGNPLNSGINVREGIVSALAPPPEVAGANLEPGNAFMVSNGLVPGDSGTPIVASRDGRLELVGISQATIGTTRIGWAIRINAIRNLLIATLQEKGWNCAPLKPQGERPLWENASFENLLGDFTCAPDST